MSDAQHDEHEPLIKTPKQLIIAVIAAFESARNKLFLRRRVRASSSFSDASGGVDSGAAVSAASELGAPLKLDDDLLYAGEHAVGVSLVG